MSFYPGLPDLTKIMMIKENVLKKFLPIIRQKIFSKKSSIQNEEQFEYSTSPFKEEFEQYVFPSEKLSELPIDEISSVHSNATHNGHSKVSVETHPKDSTLPKEVYTEELLQSSGAAQSEEFTLPKETQSEQSLHLKERARKLRSAEANLDKFLHSVKEQSDQSHLPCENQFAESFRFNDAQIEKLMCTVDERIEQLFCSIHEKIEQLKHSIKEEFKQLVHQDLQSINSVHAQNEQITSLKKMNTDGSNIEHSKQSTSFLNNKAERQAQATKSYKTETVKFLKHLGMEHDKQLKTDLRVSPKHIECLPFKKPQNCIRRTYRIGVPRWISDDIGSFSPCTVTEVSDDDTNNFQDSLEQKKSEEPRDNESSDQESSDEVVQNPFCELLMSMLINNIKDRLNKENLDKEFQEEKYSDKICESPVVVENPMCDSLIFVFMTLFFLLLCMCATNLLVDVLANFSLVV